MVHERIRSLRKERRLTQTMLAQKVGVSAQVVSNWERQYTSPDIEDLSKIAHALHTTADYLLGLSDETEDEMREIKEHLKTQGYDHPVFFDKQAWFGVQPEEIKQIENYFRFLLQQKNIS
ncbi:helix-turn-helix domain-containing protein [Halobacillus salinarum]|uniref:Helix-turn-helix domain-containing protein n=1 Tax=Halobacillus salinarum TaxID=2932257 RepID=A0ABY4EFR8_9BACI|nr:helix-turn-helix transcriptional regulator [Halobacillus salinarum]UOQ42979.1 helix-turn-helix domain-containing protein [Halobacillus salinarum]